MKRSAVAVPGHVARGCRMSSWGNELRVRCRRPGGDETSPEGRRARSHPAPPALAPLAPTASSLAAGQLSLFRTAAALATAGRIFRAPRGASAEVLPAQTLRPPRPEVIGEMPPRFLQSIHTSVPPGQVFTVTGARLLGPAGWVVTADDTFLMDAGFEANDASTPLAAYRIFQTRRGLPPRLRRLPGRCLSLASDFTIRGFGHFIHDSLTSAVTPKPASRARTCRPWPVFALQQRLAPLGGRPTRPA